MNDDDSTIIRLHKLRYSIQDLIKLIGTSKSAFFREVALYRNKLKKKKRTIWTVWEVKHLLEMMDKGFIIIIE